MTILTKAKGPLQFTSGTSEDCGCSGQTYCTPYFNGDRITFQVEQSCCGITEGCEELTEECVDLSGIEISELLEPQEDGCYFFTGTSFFASTRIAWMPYAFEDGKTYKICFCITEEFANFPTNLTIYTRNTTVYTNRSEPIQGSGTFCVTFVASGSQIEFGLYADVPPDGSVTVNDFTLCCITVCELDSYTADIIDEDNQVVAAFSPQTGNGMQIFNLPINTSETGIGCFRVRLTNTCSGAVYYSQCISLFEAPEDCDDDTLLFKYRNRNDAFGFDYSSVPTWYNYVRVKGRLKNPQWPDESIIATDSDNTNKVINARIQKLWQVVLNDLPDYIHEQIAIARRHSDLQINGVPFVAAEGSYAPEWRRSSQFASAQFEAYDQGFDGIATFCG